MHHTVVVADQVLNLLAERAAYWPERRMLLVADAHFGKAATFRARGVPVPHGTTADNLARLDALMTHWDVERIVFLGDFLHAREAQARPTIAALAHWRARHAHVAMTLVRGNHDAHAGDPPAHLKIDVVDESWTIGPFSMRHHPQPCERGYVLAGHLHPGYRVTGRAGDGLRLPCFWFGCEAGSRVGVLPAFGAFTGTWIVDALPDDRVFVVAPDAVHAIDRRRVRIVGSIA
ncbi:MAG: ligase-associated DNA damage response endonuclease PdeM [Burkholderiaceae bacterium]